jgi:hypothetical protein
MYLPRMRFTALDAMHRHGKLLALGSGRKDVLYRVKIGLAGGTASHGRVIDNSRLVSTATIVF